MSKLSANCASTKSMNLLKMENNYKSEDDILFELKEYKKSIIKLVDD
jgi:hypothetical protein